jgi:FAD-dependent urate hydroxylase
VTQMLEQHRSSSSTDRLYRISPREDVDAVVVGAGPYGLSAAAHLRAAGIETHVFGSPMESWERHMPAGMLLRSRWEASQIADPERRLSLEHYHDGHGLKRVEPIPLERFVDYGRWFQRHAVPDLDARRVARVSRENGHFRLALDDGESMTATRVVVATGIVSHAWRPPELAALSENLVSHAADHSDLRRFAGQRVAILGAGQSAVESAALLAEAGADVTVLVRSPGVEWLEELRSERVLQRLTLYAYRRIGVGGAKSSWVAGLPPLFRKLPEERRRSVTLRCIRPAAASWVRPRIAGVDLLGEASVTDARTEGRGVALELVDGRRIEADHVLLATGYRIDVRRSPILDPSLAAEVATEDGYPVLGPGLESTVPGLHFLGAPAMRAFGPVMRFVCGTWFSSRELTHRVASGATRRAWCSW